MKVFRTFAILSIVASSAMVLSSCKTKDPILTFDDADKGAYVKLIANSESGSKSIDILDQTTYDQAKYGYSVEFIDGAAGSRILRYILEVTFTDSTGTITTGPIFFRTFETTDFTLSVNNNLGVKDIEIKASQVAGLFGLTFDELKEGAKFEFSGSLVTFDNKSFGTINSSPTIRGDAYFDFTIQVVKSN